MRLPPGSFPWLVAHDLRLHFRSVYAMFGRRRPSTIALIVLVVLIVFHLLAWPVASWAMRAQAGTSRFYYPALACTTLFVLPWLTAQALTNTTRALYTRGDLDLLLASPVSARNLLTARALAISIEAVTSVAILLLPVADMSALLGNPHWLALYPALFASGLFATAIGLTSAVCLFILVGPKRTRFVAQIAATFIASAFVLGIQLVNVLPAAWREAILAAFEHPRPGSVFDRDGWLWLPVRAATGDWRDLALWVALSCAAFVAAAVISGPRFMVSAAQSAGTVSATAIRRNRPRAYRFRAGAGAALRHKEWKLLARDPWLASQMLLQIVYTLPISVVIWRSQGAGGSLALAVSPAVVVIASQISASLAWLAVSSEDAPEFIRTAPVTQTQVERRKLEAIGVPLGLLLAVPIGALAFFEPRMALWTMVCAGAAAGSTALLNFWHPMPGKRSHMLRRHAQSKIVGLMEHMMSLCWAVAMVLVVLGSAIALIPVAVVAGLLWFNRPARPSPAALSSQSA